MNYVLNVLIWIGYIVQGLFLLLGAYYFFISIFSFIPKKDRKIVDDRDHDFALVVAAHNEEQVIEHMVESLTKLN